MVREAHPESELIAFLQDELTESDRVRVNAHLAGCPACRQTLDDFRQLLGDLARAVPDPPPIHWGRYRAEIRERLAARQTSRSWLWNWLRHPLPAALGASLAVVLLFLAVQIGRDKPEGNGELLVYEASPLMGKLELFRQYAMIERLDLLEEFDVIRYLDQLSPSREG